MKAIAEVCLCNCETPHIETLEGVITVFWTETTLTVIALNGWAFPAEYKYEAEYVDWFKVRPEALETTAD